MENEKYGIIALLQTNFEALRHS